MHNMILSIKPSVAVGASLANECSIIHFYCLAGLIWLTILL